MLTRHVENLCSEGFRRSPSIKRTRRPVLARVIARLLAVVDLPSPGNGLATSSDVGLAAAPEELEIGSRASCTIPRAPIEAFDG